MKSGLAYLPKYDEAEPEALPRILRGALISLSHAKGIPRSRYPVSYVVAAYWRAMRLNGRSVGYPSDRFILIKDRGKALYVCLAYRGFFDIDELQELGAEGGSMAEHQAPTVCPA